MVPRAEQPPASLVPDGERKIAEQVLEAVLAPSLVSVKNQLRIGGSLKIPVAYCPELSEELRSGVHPGIGDDPNVPVQGAGLPLAHGLVRGAQHRVAETHRARVPALLRVRPPVGHEFGHLPEQSPIDGGAIELQDADNTAQGSSISAAAIGRSN